MQATISLKKYQRCLFNSPARSFLSLLAKPSIFDAVRFTKRYFHSTLKIPDLQSKPSIFDLLESNTGSTRQRVFHFQHASAGAPKNIGSKVTLENSLSHSVGEDAYFAQGRALGLADGVGGWVSVKGANPALYSRMLMHYVAEEFDNYDTLDFESDPLPPDLLGINPKSVLSNAYSKVKVLEKTENLVGSTTALVVQLKNDELNIANIGDGGIMILRDYEVIFRSEEQQHSFNYPYQLGTKSRDTPENCQTYTIKLHESDIVILGSDGVWDNLFDEDIVELVKSVVGDAIYKKPTPLNINEQKIADAIISRARIVGGDRHADSPFQSRASHEGLYYQGGKMDDMTCLVAVIKMAEDSPDRR